MNARLETKSETVKPIPAHAPATTSTGPLIRARGPWRTGRDAIQEPLKTRNEGEWWAPMEEVFHHD